MKLEIRLHSREDVKQVEVEEFDPAALNEKLNSNDVNTVLIGDSIFAKIDIKSVERIEEEIS